MGFRITHHPERRIIEVVYPPSPTLEDVAVYKVEIGRLIEVAAAQGAWCCLVDQRELKVLDPNLVDPIASMNALAHGRGMRRSARLVKGALATLQAGRIARTADLGGLVRTFEDREQALAWLQEPVKRQE